MDTLETVKDIVLQYHDVRRDEIGMDTSFFRYLDDDSLEFTEVLMFCEEAFGITIPDVVATQIETIGELVEYIETQRHPSVWPPAPLDVGRLADSDRQG